MRVESGSFMFVVGLALLIGTLAGCGGRMPDDLGATDGRLRACPSSPNCVSSFETDEVHGIAALRLVASPDGAWSALVAELESRERVEIVVRERDYLHAVFTTALMRYRDDVEFLLRSEAGEIALRSASRVGYGDMNANRDRIESIRAALAEKGVVEGSSSD